MIRAGIDVLVSSPGKGSCRGRIESIPDVNRLPRIAAVDAAALAMGYRDSGEAARELLAGDGVTRIALVSYGAGFIFVALEREGNWWDSRGNELILSEIAPN